jgi:inorganic triphosphatase YgiF
MAGGRRASRARLVSSYYDTPEHALAQRGATLRVRRQGRGFVQTYKLTGAHGASGLARSEWEDIIESDAPDLHAPQSGKRLAPEIAERLQPLFRTEVSRLTVTLAPAPNVQVEAAIDRGRIVDGAGNPPARISEVELELKSGEPAILYDIALDLLRIAPLRLEPRSKAERGYRLANASDGGKAAHTASLALDPSLSVAAVLRAAAHAAIDHLLRNEAMAGAGDAGSIHQMRVAARRLRAILSAFAPLLPKDQRRWASRELKWLADIFGEVRNLDVFTESLLTPSRAAVRVDAGFEQLDQAAERRRRTAQEAVATAIASSRFTETLLALLRWFDGREWHAGSDELHQPIAAVGPALLERSRRKARRCAKHFARQSPKERHRLRIALKQLRYTAELLSSLYDATKARQFIHRLKRLQDDLGDANDVRAGREIITALADNGRHSGEIRRAGRRVLAWRQRHLAKHEDDVRRHLAALFKAERFWRL